MKKKVLKKLRQHLYNKGIVNESYEKKNIIKNQARIKRDNLTEGAFTLQTVNDFNIELNKLKRKYNSLSQVEKVEFLKNIE